MKKVLSIFLLFLSVQCFSQTAEELHENAKLFMRQGDFSNAIGVLNRALAKDENNLEIAKDLAFSYNANGDDKKALDIIKPLLNREDADYQCFLIAGQIYKVQQNSKELEKLYKKGIKKFPENGALYNELGEVLWALKDYSAIKQWETGIEKDPSFPRNYYNACRFYYFSTDKVWSIIYGEIFVNLNPFSADAAEIKEILLESYKKLFADTEVKIKNSNSFTEAFVQTLTKHSSVISNGVTAQNLVMLRTRFILDWFADYAEKFPFKLFDIHQQLLKEGLFDAYNQWLFGAAENLPAYQNWIQQNDTEYKEFNKYLQSRVIKINPGQYYH